MTASIQPRLLNYLDPIEQALALVANQIVSQCGEEDFVAGRCPVYESAAMYQVARIGEIAAQIRNRYPALQEAHPEVVWRVIADTRNKWIHGYFSVDLAIVWQTSTVIYRHCAGSLLRCAPRRK